MQYKCMHSGWITFLNGLPAATRAEWTDCRVLHNITYYTIHYILHYIANFILYCTVDCALHCIIKHPVVCDILLCIVL